MIQYQDAFWTSKRSLYMAFLFVMLILGGMIYVSRLDWESQTRIQTMLIVTISIVHIAYRIASPGTSNWLAPDILYVMFYMSFHLGYLVLWFFKILPTDSEIFPYPSLYPKTMMVVFLGLIGFIVGYEIAAKAPKPIAYRQIPTALWPMMGLFLMGAAVVIHVTYIFLAGFHNFLTRGYHVASFMHLYVSNTILWSWQSLVFSMGFGVYIISVALIHKRIFAGKMGLILFVSYLTLIMLEGDRGPIISLGLIVVFVRHYLIKPIKLKTLMLFFVGFLFLFTFIGVVRSVTSFDIGKMRTEYSYARGTGQVRWYSPFVETGGSIRTVNHSIGIMESGHPYFYGDTYVVSAVRIIPFLQGFWVRHFGGTSPSAWLTLTLYGNLDRAAGTGFSLPTEGYINFGFIGVFVQMMVIGFVLRKIYIRFMTSGSPVISVIYFVSLGYFLVSVRGETNLFFATLIHVALLAYLLKLFLGTVLLTESEEDEIVESEYREY